MSKTFFAKKNCVENLSCFRLIKNVAYGASFSIVACNVGSKHHHTWQKSNQFLPERDSGKFQPRPSSVVPDIQTIVFHPEEIVTLYLKPEEVLFLLFVLEGVNVPKSYFWASIFKVGDPLINATFIQISKVILVFLD